MLLGTGLIDEHILAIPPDKKEVTVRKLAPAAIVKQHVLSANAVLTEENTQNADLQTHFQEKDDKKSTIKHLYAVRVAKQKMVESFFCHISQLYN